MATPEESRRSALDGLRQYRLVLANKLPVLRERLLELANSLIGKLPAFREHLLELARKVTDKMADDGNADREGLLRSANEGLKAYLPTEAPPTMNAIAGPKSRQQAPSAADERLIGDLIRWWMEHDPLSASRSVVDAVGLGGAHRLPEGDRLGLARAFLAMLEIDPVASRWSAASAAPEEIAESGRDATWTLGDAMPPRRPH
jgi:hypothetical protein